MKKAVKLSGAALAAAAASFFAIGATAPDYAPLAQADKAKVECKGVNACKGQSECKSASGNCKGLNECKGQGMKVMSKADCDKAQAGMKKKG